MGGIASAAIVAIVLAGSAGAATLVIRASGPSARLYPPGRAIDDHARIALQPGDQLTVLDTGGTRTLSGPGSFALGAGAATAATADTRLAAFLGRGAQQRVRIGAVRGMNAAPPHRSNIWNIDTARAGTVCVADPTAVSLWRAASAAPASLTISGGGGSARIDWSEGQAVASWPAALPVVAGGSYSLGWNGGGKPVGIELRVLGADADAGPEQTAADLLHNGCGAQLDLLVQLMAVPAG